MIQLAVEHDGNMPKPGLKSPLRPVLLTGFDAFGGDLINPSWLAVQALQGQVIRGHKLVAAQLPTEFSASSKLLAALLHKHKPILVLCVGLAGGRAGLSLERIAINVQDARIADNAGAQPIDISIIQSGPAAFFTSLPIKSMLQALTKAGLYAEVSQTAGTFVCNHVFYTLLHLLKNNRQDIKPLGGFMHVPYLPDMGLPCMAFEDIVRGLHIALTSALTTETDAVLAAGALN